MWIDTYDGSKLLSDWEWDNQCRLHIKVNGFLKLRRVDGGFVLGDVPLNLNEPIVMLQFCENPNWEYPHDWFKEWECHVAKNNDGEKPEFVLTNGRKVDDDTYTRREPGYAKRIVK